MVNMLGVLALRRTCIVATVSSFGTRTQVVLRVGVSCATRNGTPDMKSLSTNKERGEGITPEDNVIISASATTISMPEDRATAHTGKQENNQR